MAPGEFTARRGELAKQARADKDGAAAKTIRALRRPTAPASLVNALVREHGDEVDRLHTVGEELRAAQSALDGARMKQLSSDRTAMVEALSRRAAELASARDQQVTASVRHEVEETLRAAVADPDAAEAVASGQLTRALTYSGLGEVDVSGATATRPAAKPPKGEAKAGATSSTEAPAEGVTDSARSRRAAAERHAAEQEAVQAAQTLEAAVTRMAATQDARQAAEAALSERQQQVDEARRHLSATTKDHSKAKRAVQRAERDAEKARRALDDLVR